LFTVPQAAVLGTVQGLTEFLPISSSAHLVLVPWMFGWETPRNQMSFHVALHVGTVLAVVLFFALEWFLIFMSYIGDLRQRRWLGGRRGSLLPKIALATIPAAIVGKLFEDPIERFFYERSENLWLVGMNLAIFGVFLLLGERKGRQSRVLEDVTYRDVLIIGVAQCLALVPGVSRSGITILAGLILGLQRPAAARFSFLLATPITTGAVILKLGELHPSDFNASLWTGLLMSTIVGLAAIAFLLRYVQTRPYSIFVYYRWVLAAIVIGLFFYRTQTGGQPQPVPTPGDKVTTAVVSLNYSPGE
jgi:undecaprenyl-diphosphatase